MSLAALPTGRQGQLLALALLLAALGAIYLFAAAPLLELYAERAAAVENARLLVPRLKAAADELPGSPSAAAWAGSGHLGTIGVPWWRPISAISCRWWSRLVGAVCAVALGTALERGGTMTAASG